MSVTGKTRFHYNLSKLLPKKKTKHILLNLATVEILLRTKTVGKIK